MESKIVLTIDFGSSSIGVAKGSTITRIALPLPVLKVTKGQDALVLIKQLCQKEQADVLVLGLPRGLDGQETEQTKQVLKIVDKLKGALDIPLKLQDEAATSVLARERLKQRKDYKTNPNSEAAAIILEDYFNSL